MAGETGEEKEKQKGNKYRIYSCEEGYNGSHYSTWQGHIPCLGYFDPGC